MYPSTVRAMVLDGPADWWAPRLDYVYAQAQGFKQALDAFLASCGPTCPAMLDGLITRVASDPLPASYVRNGATRAGVLTSSALEVGVVSALYDVARVACADERAAVGRARRLGRPVALDGRPVLPALDRRHLLVDHRGQRGDQLRRPSGAGGTIPRAGARRRDPVPGRAPAVGWQLGGGRVPGHAAPRQGRQARRRAGQERGPDPHRGHDRRPGNAVYGGTVVSHPYRRLVTADVRQHRAHRVRQRTQCVHR